jgi:CheY-like chemotaxis protein
MASQLSRAQGPENGSYLSDMTMPNITGVELSETIMVIRTEIPIILCTGFSEISDPDSARNLVTGTFSRNLIFRKISPGRSGDDWTIKRLMPASIDAPEQTALHFVSSKRRRNCFSQVL